MSVSLLANAVKNGQFVVTAECQPPLGTDIGALESCAKALGGLVHALSVTESEDGVRMSALAACSHIRAAGTEPIMPLLSRDYNRIALQSNILGAASMGVSSVLALAGRHQALTTSGTARGVFDIDPIQMIQIADRMRKEGKLADGQELSSPIDILIGTDTNPFADPVELQALALGKAVNAGADYVMTQPVFNLDRLNIWMTYVRERKIHERACIIASVMPLTSSQEAIQLAEKYTHLDVSDDIVKRLDAASDQRKAGIEIAIETINQLKKIDGIRGIHLMTGEDFQLAADVLKASGVSRS